MSLASRALAAHEHDVKVKALEKEADRTRRRGFAFDLISRALEPLGLGIEELELEPDYRGHKWSVDIPIDADCSLSIVAETSREGDVHMRVKPVDELYRDIPPGGESRGTYGCYGLNDMNGLGSIVTLADLGKGIALVRTAREAWNRKHGVSQDSEMQKEVGVDGTA